jgi:hypothetical protein
VRPAAGSLPRRNTVARPFWQSIGWSVRTARTLPSRPPSSSGLRVRRDRPRPARRRLSASGRSGASRARWEGRCIDSGRCSRFGLPSGVATSWRSLRCFVFSPSAEPLTAPPAGALAPRSADPHAGRSDAGSDRSGVGNGRAQAIASRGDFRAEFRAPSRNPGRLVFTGRTVREQSSRDRCARSCPVRGCSDQRRRRHRNVRLGSEERWGGGSCIAAPARHPPPDAYGTLSGAWVSRTSRDRGRE